MAETEVRVNEGRVNEGRMNAVRLASRSAVSIAVFAVASAVIGVTITVNARLVAIWMSTGRPFFWPLLAIFGWGIGLAFHAWNVYWPEPDEGRIFREIERLRRRDATRQS